MSTTKDQVRAAVSVVAAVAETIRALGEVPNGTVYAQVMSHLSLEQYEQVIGVLKRADLVSEKNNVLHWCGPTL